MANGSLLRWIFQAVRAMLLEGQVRIVDTEGVATPDWRYRELSVPSNKPFEADLRKRASPACSAAQWRR